jgi:hypothetical protein
VSTVLTKDLLDQYRRAMAMLRATVLKFNRQQWPQGLSAFQTPAKVAYHTMMHHQSALTLLSIHLGNQGASWA